MLYIKFCTASTPLCSIHDIQLVPGPPSTIKEDLGLVLFKVGTSLKPFYFKLNYHQATPCSQRQFLYYNDGTLLSARREPADKTFSRLLSRYLKQRSRWICPKYVLYICSKSRMSWGCQDDVDFARYMAE